jgi:hydrogenase nickel incorporation protein HypA/HybF
MHEMGLAMSVVDEVTRVLEDFGPQARALRVTVQVGRLRAVVPEALDFCFEVASHRSRAAGARLVIEEVPIRVRCATCAREWIVERVEFFCPTCDGPVEILSGKELLLRSVEVDCPEPDVATETAGGAT